MSSIKVEGTVERAGIGSGAWALKTADGQTYELHKPPDDLKKSGVKVRVQGQIRDDVMTLAMIGPVLEVKSFEAID